MYSTATKQIFIEQNKPFCELTTIFRIKFQPAIGGVKNNLFIPLADSVPAQNVDNVVNFSFFKIIGLQKFHKISLNKYAFN